MRIILHCTKTEAASVVVAARHTNIQQDELPKDADERWHGQKKQVNPSS